MAGGMNAVGDIYALDAVTGRQSTPNPRTMYLALLISAPAGTDTLAQIQAKELSATGYARASVTWAVTSSAGVQPAVEQNSTLINFGPFTASTGSGASP